MDSATSLDATATRIQPKTKQASLVTVIQSRIRTTSAAAIPTTTTTDAVTVTLTPTPIPNSISSSVSIQSTPSSTFIQPTSSPTVLATTPNIPLIAGAAGGAVILIILIVTTICCCKRRKAKNQYSDKLISSETFISSGTFSGPNFSNYEDKTRDGARENQGRYENEGESYSYPPTPSSADLLSHRSPREGDNSRFPDNRFERAVSSPFLDPPKPVSKSPLPSPIAYPAEVSPFEEAGGEIGIVKRTFEPSLGDELVIAIGDRIRVITSFDDNWTLGINLSSSSQAKGVFPSDCLFDPPSSPPIILTTSPGEDVTQTSSFGNSPAGTTPEFINPAPSSTTLGTKMEPTTGNQRTTSPSYPFPLTPKRESEAKIPHSISSKSLAVSDKRESKRASSLVAVRERDREMLAALDFDLL